MQLAYIAKLSSRKRKAKPFMPDAHITPAAPADSRKKGLIHTVLARLLLNERRCVACHVPFTPVEAELCCPACESSLRTHVVRCRCCGIPIEDSRPGLCADCIQEPPPWDSMTCLGDYSGVLRHLLLQLKFGHDAAATELIGNLLAEACLKGSIPRVSTSCGENNLFISSEPPVLLPVPLHPMRLRERGFNQSLQLAKIISRKLKIDIDTTLLRRTINTPSQRTLNLKKRRINVQYAFTASHLARGMQILLLDDIMTTTSTIRSATKALKEAGARVDVIVAARDLLHKK